MQLCATGSHLRARLRTSIVVAATDSPWGFSLPKGCEEAGQEQLRRGEELCPRKNREAGQEPMGAQPAREPDQRGGPSQLSRIMGGPPRSL
jgi:hypothetical protein